MLLTFSEGFCQKNDSLSIASTIYFNKAVWFIKAPQFNYDSAALYFDKTITILSKNENLQYQKLAEVYLEIAQRMKFANYKTYEKALEKAKYYIYKIPVEKRSEIGQSIELEKS